MLKNILIVDDHPTMIEGYRSILSFNPYGYLFNIQAANSCQEAFEILKFPTNKNKFDAVVIDLSLPACKELNLLAGDDLIPLVRATNFTAKTIVITSHAEHFLLYQLYVNHNPDAILIKSDIISNELIEAFKAVFTDKRHYSLTMLEAKKRLTANDFFLDEIDIQIIMLLADGVKNKNLVDYLPLTISAIDKRKVKIKNFFNIEKGNDEDIIREAKAKKFI
jgi:DNA-binding NarL/FixJ family response regulator